MTAAFPPVVPYLYYPDVAKAVEFLVGAFGFKEHQVARDPDGVVWTAQLRAGADADAGLVMIGPGMAEFGSRAVADPESATCRTHVLVDDLATHYDRAVAAGALIPAEPTAGFGDVKVYVASDCGGQQWIFAESMTSESPIPSSGLTT
jgi:uncharacterized glyoxalase superfamily protein PhnB